MIGLAMGSYLMSIMAEPLPARCDSDFWLFETQEQAQGGGGRAGGAGGSRICDSESLQVTPSHLCPVTVTRSRYESRSRVSMRHPCPRTGRRRT